MTDWLPTCIEVFDCEARIIISAVKILEGLHAPTAHQARMKIEELKQKGIAKYICPLCAQTLSLRGGLQTKFVMHFAHPRMPEHKCPYKTSDNHTPEDLAAMKYNGLKETTDHRLVKARLLKALRRDAGVEPGSIHSEKIYRAKLPDKSWRKPDVDARWNGKSLIFEAQLSTTFVTVIANRRNFYTENGAELIWIFAKRPEADGGFMPFTNKDIFYNNNFNLFVVNGDTEAESAKQNSLVIEAWWPDPATFSVEGPRIDWCSKMVNLSQLTFNHEKRIVFFFNFEAAITEKEQREERKVILLEKQKQDTSDMDARVPPGSSGAFNFQYESQSAPPYELEAPDPDLHKLTSAIRRRNTEIIWQQLRKVIVGEPRLDSTIVFTAFANCKLIVPIETYAEHKRKMHFEAILSGLYSLVAGTPIGNGFRNLKEIENWIFMSHRCHYALFLRAVKRFGRENSIEANSKTSTVAKHIEEFRTARSIHSNSNIQFQQDRSLDAIFELGFSELEPDLALLARFSRQL